MSGHSKWSTIKRKKAANDAKRGAAFTRLAREITIAAQQGGDPEMNFGLRLAIDRAKAGNMPKENIERAIKRGTGELKDGVQIEEVIYEAYAGHGVAVLIDCATDNRNRTIAEIKHIMSKSGGTMAEPGSVSWQFEQKGYITIDPGQMEYDDLFLVAADAGAEDVIDGDGFIEIFTPREELHTVVDALEDAGVTIENAKLEWTPNTPLDLEQGDALKVMSVIEQLDELDDTQQVYSNLNMSDELLAALEAAAG